MLYIQSTSVQLIDNLMEMWLWLKALKPRLVQKNNKTLVYSLYGYARQDRKSSSREPITAKLSRNMIYKLQGADRILTLDLHASQIQGSWYAVII